MREVIRAFICLHKSHDVRRLRDHDRGFEVAGPPAKATLDSWLSIFVPRDAAPDVLQSS